MDIDSLPSSDPLLFSETVDVPPRILSTPLLHVSPNTPQLSCSQDTLITQSIHCFEMPESFLTQQIYTQPPVYTITGEQYNTLQSMFSTHRLPDDSLFPWLHGVDGHSYHQNLFFGIRRSPVPCYRGVLLVHADEEHPYSHRLMNSVLLSDILAPTSTEGTPTFLHAVEKEATINLRNFKIQPGRLATISDIIVYGSTAEAAALEISTAQIHLKRERMIQLEQLKKSSGSKAILNANTFEYNTFVIQEPFDTFEREYPELVAHDSYGNPVHYIHFGDKEKKEMLEMSAATEITPNLWVGNTQDTPVSLSLPSQEKHQDAGTYYDNPHQFSICIESHDLADMPHPSTLALAQQALDALPVDQLPTELVHLDVYSTGSSIDSATFDVFNTRLIPLFEFMEAQVIRGRRILIHCSDGYTETSLIVLSWIMYKEKIRLPKAYLYLQQRRSFFVYAWDVMTLKQVDWDLQKRLITHRDHKRKRQDTASIEDTSTNLLVYTPQTHTKEEENPHLYDTVKENRTLHDDAYINAISNAPIDTHPILSSNIEDITSCLQISSAYEIDETVPCNLLTEATSEYEAQDRINYPWFYSSRFEGSFPSRILPFLYLGNLNHATNPDMLNALNITHVISVGEDTHLDPKHFQLLALDPLYDNGIDSIRMHFNQIIHFVEDACQKGSRCLVHCRVGVSRSAAVTIAYVMHHLGLNLVEAYLFVRARRLNVIIQPNLKLMYEILQLEQHFLGKTMITWPVLANEIHLLNASYREG
ncbi:hypothetical protein BDF14DRAFT_1751490 [Spinellus fusiger]|nr:hypothetical protein BDF14DRAFT_1751490 [Spinellus fusiger]